MRRLLLLSLGLQVLLLGRCLEFVIDGEREDEAVSLYAAESTLVIRNPILVRGLKSLF